MKISLSPNALLKLETWCATAGGKEVSGLGTVSYKDGGFIVDEVWLLDAGSEVFTEIPPGRIAELHSSGVDLSKLKLWWHRHPVGNGTPGPACWSSIDENTITNQPLGSSPEMVKWSVSIVRTPYGWVGRVDHYVKKQTVHCVVDQPFDAAGHNEVYRMLGRATRQSYLHTPKVRDHRPTKKEKHKVVQAAMNIFGKDKVTRGPGRNFLMRMLADHGLEYDQYQDIKSLLREGELVEDIAELYGLDLWTIRDLKLITWQEMEDAMIRQHDARLAQYGSDSQFELFDQDEEV